MRSPSFSALSAAGGVPGCKPTNGNHLTECGAASGRHSPSPEAVVVLALALTPLLHALYPREPLPVQSARQPYLGLPPFQRPPLRLECRRRFRFRKIAR